MENFIRLNLHEKKSVMINLDHIGAIEYRPEYNVFTIPNEDVFCGHRLDVNFVPITVPKLDIIMNTQTVGRADWKYTIYGTKAKYYKGILQERLGITLDE